MRPSWFKISAILAGLWLVVGGVLWVLEGRQPSVEKIVGLLQVPGTTMAEVAARYHRLSYEQRTQLLNSPELATWWKQLSMPERRAFREMLFPQLLRVVEFFDKLPFEQRRRQLDRLAQEVRKRGGENRLTGMSALAVNVVAAQGVKPFFDDPKLDETMDPLLMILEMEKQLIWRKRV